MNAPVLARSGVVNALLLSVARRIQLPLSSYRLAAERYDTLGQHLDRDGSPLQGLVSRLYPQGSMAIGAVISSRFDNDEFDVDVIVELAVGQVPAPALALDTLYRSIRGEPGSRYYDKTKRRTRCITVEYGEMHIDFTPAVRLNNDPRERVSFIFHAHENDGPAKHHHVLANPWGFAQWFERQMPAAERFARDVLAKSMDPLPDPEELNEKSLPLVALQLIKRWRNKRYCGRDGVRVPPSVMLSCLIAQNSGFRAGLLDELSAQVTFLLSRIEAADRDGRLLRVMNPACSEGDCFTDRWPISLVDQRVFLNDLRAFAASLVNLGTPQSLEDYQRILGQLFGERATNAVISDFAKRYQESAERGTIYYRPGSGAAALPQSGLARAVGVAPAVVVPRHTNFGSDIEE